MKKLGALILTVCLAWVIVARASVAFLGSVPKPAATSGPAGWGVYATATTNTAGFVTPISPVRITSTAGNSVIIALFVWGANDTNRALFSSAGNTYTKIGAFNSSPNNYGMTLYLATNVAAGLDIVGITDSNTFIGANSSLCALACTGVSGFDVVAANTSSPSSPATVTMTTTVTDKFLQFSHSGNGPYGASQTLSPSSASSTNVIYFNNSGNLNAQVDSFGSGFAANSYTATFTYTVFGDTLLVLLALK